MDSQRLLGGDDYYYPVGVVIEALFYGCYTSLFLIALFVWKKRQSQSFSTASLPALVYLVFIVLMWVVATAHFGISVRRLLRVFITELETKSAPTAVRLLDATRWDTLAHMALVSCMISLGDLLVIYRTYIVWNKNIWVIALPLVLHVAYIVVNSSATYWLSHPNKIAPEDAYAWYRPVFPLVFAQNVLTTGLLSYKVWSQHRASTKFGVMNASSNVSLGYIARMLIETAMVYTVQLLVIIIMGTIKHPAKGLIVLSMVPTLGTVFVLMSIRAHFGETSKSSNSGNDLPDWLNNPAPDHSIELTRPSAATRRAEHSLGRNYKMRNSMILPDSDFDLDGVDFPTVSFSRKNSRNYGA